LLAVVAMLVLGMAFTAGVKSSRVNAQDGASLTAAIVSGSCDSPGDTAADLRDLTPAEGGVLTSFTRIDIAIEDLTGGGYAVLVSSGGDAAACGDIAGAGNDVYVAVTSLSDAGYGGIGWMHARDAQTQVSLFISQGLGGSSASSDNGSVEPPSDETPEPPAADTPQAKSTSTPRAKPTSTPRARKSPTAEANTGKGATYTSPTFGYSMTYDSTWENREETTTPTDNGPQDFLHLFNGTSHAYLFTNGADETFPMDQLPDVLQGRLEGSDAIANVSIRQDDNGNDILQTDESSAIVAFNLTWTNQNGQQFELYDYYHGFKLPGQNAVLIFLNEGLQQSYDQQAAAREKLENSIQLP